MRPVTTMVMPRMYLLLSLVTISTARRAVICQHKENVEHAVHGVQLEPHEHVAKRVANQPARFSVFYDSSISNQLTIAVQNRVQATMSKLTTFLSQTLQVKPVGVPILLDQRCTTSSFVIINGLRYCTATCAATTMCGQAVVPASHLQVCRQCNGGLCVQNSTNGTGVSSTDYIFYVSAVNTPPCGTASDSTTAIAFATYCQTESSLDRPIAGNINFCSSVFSSLNDDNIFGVIKHEALHALGFSKALFPFWRDQNGNPRTPRNLATNLPPIVNGAYQSSNTTVMALQYTNWVVSTGTISHPVNLLVTPNVVAAAQIYFNCSSLIGVELENQGTSGTAGSHWEKRILGDELMTGDLTFNLQFSILTLAALQDTGWYQVNYSMAQPLVWGQNAGCLFAAGSCEGYIASQLALGSSIDPFCNHYSPYIDLLGCTVDRGAVSYCNLVQYSSALPIDYQYFSFLGNNSGGGDELADYCPYEQIFVYTNDVRETVCSNATNNPSSINILGETYGQGSACVLHGSVGWSVNISGVTYTPYLSGAGCYQYSYINNSLAIEVLGTNYPCLAAGEQINVSATVNDSIYEGSLICPSYNQLSGGTITNPCDSNNGGCSQTCTSIVGSFVCSCMIGYILGADNRICNDINECAINHGECSQICTNTIGSFVCSCMIGYTLGANNETCNDIDECLPNNGGCSHICTNTNGSYFCSCMTGYALGSDNETCSDINECSANNGECSQTCSNTNGSFVCSCMIGYTLSADNLTCNDINECSINNGGCSQTCTNTNGSYVCSCMIGYTFGADNITCNDINECAMSNGGCSQMCNNTNGSFVCSCTIGYMYMLADDSKTCIINECLNNNGGCSQTCINANGSFSCSCMIGYTLGADNKTCSDINECLTTNGGCSQICTNTNGSFVCSCRIGYTMNADNKTCNDINECLKNDGGCSQTCINTNGSFICSCMIGYTLDVDSRSCNDINECLTTNKRCSHICVNTNGSFTCLCMSGYTLGANNETCNVINQCSKNNGGCSQICTVTNGSYVCTCMIGYTLSADNNTCSDINECFTTNGGCSQICTNTIGSFVCSCMAGYTLGADNNSCNDTASISWLNGQVARIVIGGGAAAAILLLVAICLPGFLMSRYKSKNKATDTRKEHLVMDNNHANTSIQMDEWRGDLSMSSTTKKAVVPCNDFSKKATVSTTSNTVTVYIQ